MMRELLIRENDEKKKEFERESNVIDMQPEKGNSEKSEQQEEIYQGQEPPARGSDKKRDHFERGSDNEDKYPGRGSG
jgi:hypothetical protein